MQSLSGRLVVHVATLKCSKWKTLEKMSAFLASFAEVYDYILFSGQLPTGRSVEPEVQVKQQQTTINGNVKLIKKSLLGEKACILCMQNISFYHYYCIINTK